MVVLLYDSYYRMLWKRQDYRDTRKDYPAFAQTHRKYTTKNELCSRQWTLSGSNVSQIHQLKQYSTLARDVIIWYRCMYPCMCADLRNYHLLLNFYYGPKTAQKEKIV